MFLTMYSRLKIYADNIINTVSKKQKRIHFLKIKLLKKE